MDAFPFFFLSALTIYFISKTNSRPRLNDPFQGRSLNDLTEDEIFKILSNNNNTDVKVLSAISSEVLRRKIVKERKEERK